MTDYTARHQDLTGASLSGTEATTGRTYALAYANAVVPLFSVKLQGRSLHYTDEWTLTSNTITFLVEVWNDQIIDLDYLTTTSTTTTSTLRYATTSQLAAVLNIASEIPNWEVGSSPSIEEVGTGTGSLATFYLDHKNVLAGSYTIGYGATSASTTALTETTHFVLTKDSGKIVLTTAGLAAVGSNKVFAEYQYVNINLKDSYLHEVLLRAEQEVDSSLGTTFTDGTASNPTYPHILTEKHVSQGLFNKGYFTRAKPIIDITSDLAVTITSASTSLDVTSGHGVKFPSSGYILLGSEIISYSSVNSDTFGSLGRGALGSTAAAHSAGADIHTIAVQVSGTDEGGVPTYYTLAYDSEFSVSEDGKIYILDDTLYNSLTISNNLLYKQGVPDRLRVSYHYGWDTIPKDITRLTVLVAERMLFNDTIISSLIKGRNEFRPEIVDLLNKEISAISNIYAYIDMNNT